MKKIALVYILIVILLAFTLLVKSASANSNVVISNPECGIVVLSQLDASDDIGVAHVEVVYENGDAADFYGNPNVYTKTGAVGYRVEYAPVIRGGVHAMSFIRAYIESGETVIEADGSHGMRVKQCVFIPFVGKDRPWFIPPG